MAAQTPPSDLLQQELECPHSHALPSQPDQRDDSSTLFRYKHLAPGEIRLLTPTNDPTGLSWTIRVARLDDKKLEFDALSYTWGDQAETYSIKCNGQEHHVHHNLYTALPYLARRYGYRPTWKLSQSTQENVGAGDEVPCTKECPGMVWKRSSDGDPEQEQPQRAIWIDAICINQADEKEKHVQIALMNKVYQRATMVWVWLGLDTNQNLVQDAVDLLPTIAIAAENARTLFLETRSKDGNRNPGNRDPYIHAVWQIDSPTWRALLKILGNEWFRRVWVVQEYLLANEAMFLCGEHAMSADLVESALHQQLFLWNHTVYAAPGMNTAAFGEISQCGLIIRARDHRRIQLAHRSISRPLDQAIMANVWLRLSLSINTFNHCSLPQDRVLGILGLLNEEQYEALGVDLHHSTDIPGLYTKFSAAVLPLGLVDTTETASWELLAKACHSKKTRNLPSWVADLHNFKGSSNLNLTVRSGSKCKASARQVVVKNGQQQHELIMRGTLLYTVFSVCTAIRTPGASILDRILYFTKLAEWERTVRGACPDARYIGAVRRVNRAAQSYQDRNYWRFLFGDQLRYEDGIFDNQSYRCFSNALQRLDRNVRKFVATQEPSSTEFHLRPSMRAIAALDALMDPSSRSGKIRVLLEDMLEQYQMFYTTENVPGFANRGVSVGDRVCVFNGAPVPHIVRSAPDQSKEAYLLVGEAYVPGLMLGEVDEMGLPDQDILLV